MTKSFQDRRAAKLYAEQLHEPHTIQSHYETMNTGDEMFCNLCNARITKTLTKSGFSKMTVSMLKDRK